MSCGGNTATNVNAALISRLAAEHPTVTVAETRQMFHRLAHEAQTSAEQDFARVIGHAPTTHAERGDVTQTAHATARRLLERHVDQVARARARAHDDPSLTPGSASRRWASDAGARAAESLRSSADGATWAAVLVSETHDRDGTRTVVEPFVEFTDDPHAWIAAPPDISPYHPIDERVRRDLTIATEEWLTDNADADWNGERYVDGGQHFAEDVAFLRLSDGTIRTLDDIPRSA